MSTSKTTQGIQLRIQQETEFRNYLLTQLTWDIVKNSKENTAEVYLALDNNNEYLTQLHQQLAEASE